MSGVLYLIGGVAIGVAIGTRLKPGSSARCCEQLEQLTRGEVRKRCGSFADVCEAAGDWFGVFPKSSTLLDRFGVTRP